MESTSWARALAADARWLGDGDAVGTVSRGVVNVVMLRKGNQCEQCERS